ncbi:hypothetical protein SRHO_G00124200 [Serrasalmus rhombeus]
MLAVLELLWDGMRWCSPAPLPPRQPELTAMSPYCRGARSLSASKVEQPLPSSPTRCSITPRAAKRPVKNLLNSGGCSICPQKQRLCLARSLERQ